MVHMRRKKGGAGYDIYCFACGLPLHGYSTSGLKYSDLTNIQKNKIKDEMENVDTNWMDSNVGIDYNNTLFFSLGAYSGEDGLMEILNDQDYSEAREYLEANPQIIYFNASEESFNDYNNNNNNNNNNDQEDKVEGVVIHKDCLKVLEKKIGRPVETSDIEIFADVTPCTFSSQSQFYDWEKVILKSGGNYFKSPLENEKLQRIILSCMQDFLKHAPSKPKVIVSESRNLPKNATNAITMEPIENGNTMVNFHDEYKHGRFYTKNTYDKFRKKENPVTREPILDTVFYKAKIVGGRKKKTIKKRSHKKSHSRRRKTHSRN